MAVTILVKEAGKEGPGTIHYHDIGDYLSREEKLSIIEGFASIQHVPWETITPNESNDWINQRSDDFHALKPLTGSQDAIFAVRSNGVQTNRDNWVYNFSQSRLEANIQKTIDYYNTQVQLHFSSLSEIKNRTERLAEAKKRAGADPKSIKWTRGLFNLLGRGKRLSFNAENVGVGLYRPFQKSWLYYDKNLNEYYVSANKSAPVAGN